MDGFFHGLISSHAQRVGDSIYIVKPGSNQRDLKYTLVVETYGAKSLVIFWRDARCVARDLHHVVEHHHFLLGDRRLAVVVFERSYQLFV